MRSSFWGTLHGTFPFVLTLAACADVSVDPVSSAETQTLEAAPYRILLSDRDESSIEEVLSDGTGLVMRTDLGREPDDLFLNSNDSPIHLGKDSLFQETLNSDFGFPRFAVRLPENRGRIFQNRSFGKSTLFVTRTDGSAYSLGSEFGSAWGHASVIHTRGLGGILGAPKNSGKEFALIIVDGTAWDSTGTAERTISSPLWNSEAISHSYAFTNRRVFVVTQSSIDESERLWSTPIDYLDDFQEIPLPALAGVGPTKIGQPIAISKDHETIAITYGKQNYSKDSGEPTNQRLLVVSGDRTVRDFPMPAEPQHVDRQVSLSPDGKFVAFETSDQNRIKFELWIADVTTGKIQPVKSKAWPTEPHFSKLYWSSNQDIYFVVVNGDWRKPSSDLYHLNLGTGSVRNVSNHGSLDFQSSWVSPNEEILYFKTRNGPRARNAPNNGGILAVGLKNARAWWVISPEDLDVRSIQMDFFTARRLVDFRYQYFTASNPGKFELSETLMRFDVNTGKAESVEKVFAGTGPISSIAISPDGRLISFKVSDSYTYPEPSAVYVARTDNSPTAAMRVVPQGYLGPMYRWLPQSEGLVYAARDFDIPYETWAVNVALFDRELSAVTTHRVIRKHEKTSILSAGK